MRQNLFIDAAQKVADDWEREATQRKQRTPSDPAADAIASCASELRAKMAEVDRDTAYLTVAGYAQEQGVDASSVRRWCIRGEVEGAEKGPDNDWRIPRNARRVRAQRASA